MLASSLFQQSKVLLSPVKLWLVYCYVLRHSNPMFRFFQPYLQIFRAPGPFIEKCQLQYSAVISSTPSLLCDASALHQASGLNIKPRQVAKVLDIIIFEKDNIRGNRVDIGWYVYWATVPHHHYPGAGVLTEKCPGEYHNLMLYRTMRFSFDHLPSESLGE